MVDMQAEHRRLTGEDMLSENEIVGRAQRRLIFSGVYFLIKDDRIVYVGQAQDVDVRIEQHRKDKDFDSFTYVQAFGDQLDVLESMYIHHFQPELNARFTDRMRAPLHPESVSSCRVSLQDLGSKPSSVRVANDDGTEAVLRFDLM